MDYPESCLRGIPNNGFMANSKPNATLFYWSEQEKKDDGTWALSINWNDDANAVNFTLSQKKSDGDTPKFRTGVAVVEMGTIDQFNLVIPRSLLRGR